MAAASQSCPWPDCGYETLNLDGSVAIELLRMHRTAVHSPSNLPAEHQPRVKLPHLEMSTDGLVSEAAMGIFRQQLTSYKRSLGIQADNPDSILQSLPQTAYSHEYSSMRGTGMH